MNLEVRKLTISDEKAFYEGLQLFSDMDSEWYSFIWNEEMSYQEMLAILHNESKGINVPDYRVPSTMLYAFLGEKIVGSVSVRHQLNDYLFNEGGNIGYSVATTYRQKGIATHLLNSALEFCRKELKLEQVLITCDDDNIGSYKVIEKCGGKLEAKNISNDGTQIKRRYWIKL